MPYNQVKNVALSMALLCLVGCAHFEPKPIAPAENVGEFDARSLTDSGLKEFIEQNLKQALPAWPPASWDFKTLTLAAFYYNPDLDVARARWGIAQAGKITAGERPNPTVFWTPTYDTTTPPPWILGFSLDIPIETAGKRGYRISQARNLSEAARLNIAATAWSVRSRVYKSLLSLYAALQREALLLEQEQIQTQTTHLLEEEIKLGAVSGFEVTQSRLALNRAQLALRDAQRQLAAAKAELATALGVPAKETAKIKISLEGFKTAPGDIDFQMVRRAAALNRADILSALSEYAASEAALRLEIARQYPDIHLNPGYQLDQTDNKWTLGLTVTLPVLNQNQGAIAEAAARRKETAARFNNVQINAVQEIDLAIVNYRAAVDKISTANSLLQQENGRTESLKSMFAAGEVSRPKVTLAQLELNTTRLAQLDALLELQQAVIALEDASQHPLDSSSQVPIPGSKGNHEK